MESFSPTREYAKQLDERGGLGVSDRFDVPEDTVYVDGNSLGACPVGAKRALERIVAEWQSLGIEGWRRGNPPWVDLGDHIGSRIAPLVGAREHEVVVANSTTVNIHTLIGTFLDARRGPQTVLVDDLNFPTDRYAIEAQLGQRYDTPEDHLVAVESDDGRMVEESAISDAIVSRDIDIVWLPSVYYRSGQRIDIEQLTTVAHENDAVIGFDLAHSVGVIPHDLSEDGVDFAAWCHYKYINAGPGAVAGLYVNDRHHDLEPALAGWWGNDPATRFELELQYRPAGDARRWQIGTVPVLSAASLDGALDVFDDVDIDAIREQSLRLTSYLIELVDERLPECDVGTPRAAERRGGHVAIEHPDAVRLAEALRDRGVIVDARPPNVVRVCPSPLYTSFEAVWLVVDEFRRVLAAGAHESYDEPGGVT